MKILIPVPCRLDDEYNNVYEYAGLSADTASSKTEQTKHKTGHPT